MNEEVKEIARQIGQFFLAKNSGDYQSTRTEIERLRINGIEFKETLVIETSCPGLLIGKRGEQVEKLEKYLGLKIKIVETPESIEDYLIPYEDHYDPYEDEQF